MNLNKIVVGQVIKNYKELCSLLEEKIRTNTKDKTPQLEEWSRYFKYHKQGNSFVIDEIYNNPLPEPFRTDDVYSAYIQVILCNYLIQPENLKNNCSCLLTKKQLFNLCGMVNNSYINDGQKHDIIEKFKKENDLSYESTKWQVNQLNQKVNSRLTNILYRSLTRLQKKRYIVYFDHYTISEKDTKTNSTVLRDTTDNEISIYLSESNSLKDKMGINYLNDYNSETFYNTLNHMLLEKYGWNSCFKQIKIIIAKGYMEKAYHDSLNQLKEEIDKNKKCVNSNVADMFLKLIDMEFEKNRQEVNEKRKEIANSIWGEVSECWIDDKHVKEKYPNQKILNYDYTKLQKELVDLFIKINNEDN